MIKILRLKTGVDVVGYINDTNKEEYTIEHPMIVGVESRGKNPGLMMHHWLPVQLVKDNKASIKPCDILTTFELSKEFEEYYINTIKSINELLEAKKLADEMTDEEIEDAMSMMEDRELNNLTIH